MKQSEQLTKWQFIFCGVCYMMGSVLHTSMVTATAGRDAWLMPLFALIAFIPNLAVYCGLITLYPNLCIYNINECVFGKIIGRVVTVLYLFFFIHVATLNTMELQSFTASYILRGTPVIVCGAVALIACAYTVYKGIHTIARVTFGLMVTACVVFAVSWLFSIQQLNVKFLLPTLAQPVQQYVKPIQIMTTVNYGEIFVLLALAGRPTGAKSARSAVVIVAAIAALYTVQVHLKELLLLGPLAQFVSVPTFEAVRIIGFSDSNSRTETVYALVLLAFTLFRILLAYAATMWGMGRLFNIDCVNSLILPLAVLITFYAMRVMVSPENSFYYGITTTPFIWSFFTLFLPLITLFVGGMRKLAAPRIPSTQRAAQ